MGAKYSHISLDERLHISFLLDRGYTPYKIAIKLGRNISTIYREVNRNKGFLQYNAVQANKSYFTNRRKSVYQGKKTKQELVDFVQEGLRKDWSPQQVEARMKLVEEESVSFATIYRWINKKIVRPETNRKFRVTRRTKTNAEKAIKFIDDKDMIGNRPPIVATRESKGHWEVDTIYGKKDTKSCLLTLVERKTRYLFSILLPDRKSRSVQMAMENLIDKYPNHFKTVTYDQGSEFAKYKELEYETGVKGYFCEAGKPYQKGTNENTNGLIRYYYPKKTNFDKITQGELDRVVEKINNRPRIVLDGYTAHEKLIGGY